MRGRGLWVVVGVVAAGLVACTANTEPPSRTGPSIVEHPKASAPVDRDPKAVLAALRRIDLCAVLDSAAAATPGFSAGVTLSARSPFGCSLTAGHNLYVEVGYDSLSAEGRIGDQADVLGGAKAYLATVSDGGCTIALPVSFENVLRFDFDWQMRPPADTCVGARPLVAAAAKVLMDPAAARVDPRWDACTAMDAAGDEDADAASGAFAGGLADCEVSPSVAISYGSLAKTPSIGTWRRENVAGQPVLISEDKESSGPRCTVVWRLGPARTRYAAGPDRLATVIHQDCDRAEELVGPLARVLRSPASAHDPQQPVLYPPEEPDVPYPGACAYYQTRPREDCQPAVDVAVPAGRGAFIRAAEADANVYCALARAAVSKHFGPQLEPITVIGPDPQFDVPEFEVHGDDFNGDPKLCYFVEPQRRVQVAVGMWLDSGEDLARELDKVNIAGHPGYASAAVGACTFWVGMTNHPDRDGMLKLRVENGPVAPHATKLVPAFIDKARQTVADILAQHF
jgi:hypothetical protein